MKTIILSGLALAATATVAMAAPVKSTEARSNGVRPAAVQSSPVQMTDAEMDKVAAGAITQTNGGGNTPNGNANGIPASNPAGHEPPGQNK